jgi:hypothetical protein
VSPLGRASRLIYRGDVSAMSRPQRPDIELAQEQMRHVLARYFVLVLPDHIDKTVADVRGSSVAADDDAIAGHVP